MATRAPRSSPAVSLGEKANEYGHFDTDLTDMALDIDSKLTPTQYGFLSLGLCIGLFLSVLDTSIVSTSLYTVAVEFSAFEIINWVALAYTLGYLGFAVFFTQMADIFGRRNAYATAFIIFCAFSAGCGFAQNVGQLIAYRALQGIGGSGIYSITMVIFPEITPFRNTHMIGGLCGMVVAAAGVLGPILGGTLSHYATWRWIFWINFPLGMIAITAITLAWPERGQIIEAERRPWKQVDFVGSGLLIAASVLVIFAFQHASSDPSQWGRPVFILSLIVGLMCWACVFLWGKILSEWKPHVMATWPNSLLRNRVYVLVVLVTLLMAFPYFTIIFAMPLRYQLVNRETVQRAGVLLVPLLAATAIGSIVGSRVNKFEDRIFGTTLAAACLVMLGCGLLTTLSSSQMVEGKCLGFLVFVGFGNGLHASSSIMLASFEASFQDRATAQGILAQLRILGGSFGIAASSAVLSRYIQAAADFSGTTTAQELAWVQHGGAAASEITMAIIGDAFAGAFKEDMRNSAILAAMALLCALGMYRKERRSVEMIRRMAAFEELERCKAIAQSTGLRVV